jgi:maltose O-acetyltransferase
MTEGKTWRGAIAASEPFAVPDWGFFDELYKARELAGEFNRLGLREFDRKLELLKRLFGKFGEGAWIEPTLGIDLGYHSEIGDRTFLNSNCTLLDTYPIRIGADVQMGPNCMLFAGAHPMRYRERKIFDDKGAITGGLTTGAPVVIEDGVWLAGGVIVCSGVTIGARSVIGAGSVVTRNVPPDVFAAGNPCRVIRPIDN